MALAQPTNETLFKPMSVELAFIGIDKFPKDALAESVALGKDEIQFDGVRQASEYGTRQQMNYTVFMKKYDNPNFYQPYAINASIENKPEKTRRFNLSDVPLKIENIQNLLNGRHVEKHRFDRFSGKVEPYWYQLDFSKLDGHGYVLREISADQLAKGKSAVKWDRLSTAADLIQAFPLLENRLPNFRFQLAQDVARGDAAGVSVITNSGTLKGYLQFGERPDKIDLLIHKNGKLVKVGPDLQERTSTNEIQQERSRRKTKSL